MKRGSCDQRQCVDVTDKFPKWLCSQSAELCVLECMCGWVFSHLQRLPGVPFHTGVGAFTPEIFKRPQVDAQDFSLMVSFS